MSCSCNSSPCSCAPGCVTPTACPPRAPQLYFMQGLQGQRGPVAILRGNYDGTTIYYDDSQRVDIVTYTGFWWIAANLAKNATNSWGTPSASGGDWVNIGLATSNGTNSYGITNNGAGDSTVVADSSNHTENVTIAGAAGTRNIALDAAAAAAGDVIALQVTVPATAGIILKVQNATVGGTQLLPTSSGFTGNAYTTDGVTLSATWRFVFTGTTWLYQSGSSPA